MAELGFDVLDLAGPIWERTVGENERQSKIDLVFTCGENLWEQPEIEKILSKNDLWLTWITLLLWIHLATLPLLLILPHYFGFGPATFDFALNFHHPLDFAQLLWISYHALDFTQLLWITPLHFTRIFTDLAYCS